MPIPFEAYPSRKLSSYARNVLSDIKRHQRAASSINPGLLAILHARGFVHTVFEDGRIEEFPEGGLFLTEAGARIVGHLRQGESSR